LKYKNILSQQMSQKTPEPTKKKKKVPKTESTNQGLNLLKNTFFKVFGPNMTLVMFI
jgi:hypothetical protein